MKINTLALLILALVPIIIDISIFSTLNLAKYIKKN